MLLLLTGSGDAFGVHACPHHDAVSQAAMAQAGHAGMHGHGAGHDAPADAEDHGACTCLGACFTATAAPLPRAVLLPVARVVSVSTPATSTVALPRRGRLPYVLPYATAPPVRLA